MRQGDVAFSAVHLFVVAFLFALGAMCLVIAASETVRFNLSQMIFHSYELLWQIGLIIVGTSILLFSALFFLNKKRYLELELDSPASVSRPLLEELLLTFFSERFPQNTPHSDVNITKKGIEVVASIPDISSDLLESIELELPAFLSTNLGKEISCSLKLT